MTLRLIRMSAIILILQLGLAITSGFTVSSEYYTSAEPILYLECLNDFLTEMVCRLTSEQVVTCSEYDLRVSRDDELFTCDLKQRNSSSPCECLMHVESGFVLGEFYTVQVLRGKNLVLTKSVNTTESIKPQKPVRVSVKQTQSQNFLIAWDTEYRTKEAVLSLDLISELTYYIDGSKSKKTVTVSPMGQFEYELVGRNLESNSNYIVIARIKSPLNQRFSDYSHPVGFTTPPSPYQVLKIIIPVVCIILIISVLVIYYSCNKILTKWWDKIPTPKIATSFVKQVPNLLTFQNELSPVLVSSKLVQSGDKIWPPSSPVDVRSENSLISLDKDGNSSEVSYSQTVIRSLEANSSKNNIHGKESQSTSNQMPVSTQYYKNLKVINCDVRRERENSSDFNNLIYKFYNPTSGHAINPEIEFPALKNNLTPMIKTDFEYGPLSGSSGFANATLSQFPPTSSEIIMVHGYQSVCAATHQAFISSHNDVNLIMEKICNKKGQNISCESPVISADNEYKDVQRLLRNSGKQQQILITDPELEQLWGLDLHSSPGIEIDCSYHRV